MTEKELVRIIKEEIVGRSSASPLTNASDVEKRAELVIADFFTLTSREIKRYVNGRANKYGLDANAVNATVAALNALFSEQRLNSTVMRRHNMMTRNGMKRTR